MELLIISKPWKLLDDYQVELYLSNSLEINILERAEQELTQFIRRTLRNGAFKLTAVIKEMEAKDQLYTDRDKFHFMVKENPDLQRLKDELGLDFEF